MERKNHQDFLTAIVTGLIGLFALVESFNINGKYYARPQHGDVLTSPGLMPRFLGIALIICALFLLARSLKGGAGPVLSKVAESAKAVCANALVRQTLLGLVVIAVYIFFLVELLGFTLGTIVFLCIIMYMLKAGSKKKIAFISVVTAIAIVIVFTDIFHIRLP